MYITSVESLNPLTRVYRLVTTECYLRRRYMATDAARADSDKPAISRQSGNGFSRMGLALEPRKASSRKSQDGGHQPPWLEIDVHPTSYEQQSTSRSFFDPPPVRDAL